MFIFCRLAGGLLPSPGVACYDVLSPSFQNNSAFLQGQAVAAAVDSGDVGFGGGSDGGSGGGGRGRATIIELPIDVQYCVIMIHHTVLCHHDGTVQQSALHVVGRLQRFSLAILL